MCVQLLGDRFIRRMIRVLVATAMREALPAAQHVGGPDALLEVAQARNRLVTPMALVAAGLCFAEAGYGDEPHLALD